MTEEEEQQKKDNNVTTGSIEKLSSLFLNSDMKDSFDIISAICNENVSDALLFL